jgi:hypothetical protein
MARKASDIPDTDWDDSGDLDDEVTTEDDTSIELAASALTEPRQTWRRIEEVMDQRRLRAELGDLESYVF